MNSLSDVELIALLRRSASIWFKNADLLLLEELIRRYHGRGIVIRRAAGLAAVTGDNPCTVPS